MQFWFPNKVWLAFKITFGHTVVICRSVGDISWVILSTQDFDQQRKSRQTFGYVRVPNCPRQNGEHLPRKSVNSTSSLLTPGFFMFRVPIFKNIWSRDWSEWNSKPQKKTTATTKFAAWRSEENRTDARSGPGWRFKNSLINRLFLNFQCGQKMNYFCQKCEWKLGPLISFLRLSIRKDTLILKNWRTKSNQEIQLVLQSFV